MRTALLACALAAAGLAVAYAALLAVGALAGGWSGETLRDQAIGLALHGGVVAVRGLLPTVLLTAALRAALARTRGRPVGAFPTSGLAALAAAIAVPACLTSDVGSWPHLQIDTAADAAATVVLLALGSAAATLLAGRLPASPRAETTPAR